MPLVLPSLALFSTVARAADSGAPPAPSPIAPEAAPPAPARARFIVTPFANASAQAAKQRSLDFLDAGVPVLLAERLARHPSLRFSGAPAVLEKGTLDEALARASAAGVSYVVAGRYEKRPDWKIEVTVEVFAGGLPAKRVGQAHAAGAKDDVARTAITAAIDAFADAGVFLPDDARAALVTPFGRDPYAFVLFGRGVAAFVGIDGHPGSGDRALPALSRSLVIDPKVPETRRYVGVVHLAGGRPGHARAMWSCAVDLRPDYLAAVAGLAALDRTAGLPTARERYARVLELDPEDLGARRAYGELLSEAGMLPEAQTELGRVVAAAPNDLRARRALALVLASRRAGVELAAELTEVVRLDPDDLEARLDLGAALSSIGRIDPAIAAYEEVLRRKPRQPAVLKLAADLYRAKGDLQKAIGYYERLRRLAPDDPRPVFLLGKAYYETGRLDAAERMFTDGAHFPGMLGDAYSNLGAIAVRRGHVSEALWFLSRAAQRRATKAGVHYNYALALRAADRHEEALAELDTAAKIDPNDAEARFVGGVVALRLGRTADAEARFQEVLRLDPAHERARHNLALLESLKVRNESEYSFAK